MHLTLNCCVINQFKMLEYYRVCSAFESVYALHLSVIYYFSDGLKSVICRILSAAIINVIHTNKYKVDKEPLTTDIPV